MKHYVEKLITQVIQAKLQLDPAEVKFAVLYPEPHFGDYSTNVAFVLSKKVGQNPHELAEQIAREIQVIDETTDRNLSSVSVVKGFINFQLSHSSLLSVLSKITTNFDQWSSHDLFAGKRIMIEYTDPNPFKPFHIGHLMTNAIGEALSRLIANAGAEVVRANYQGDVGPHVAKAIWGLRRKGLPAAELPLHVQAEYIGECYAFGSEHYEEYKSEIDELNKRIYTRTDSDVNEIYDWGRRVTLEAFEEMYVTLGTKFDRYYFESEVNQKGLEVIRQNTGSVFELSDGAVVFHGEKYNPHLHTRVFVTSHGLPTYEAKELGLIQTKFEEYTLDTSITVTANEQLEYMKVVEEAISLLRPDIRSRLKHITHGMMRFASGKMSSRKGNVVTGESLMSDSYQKVKDRLAAREYSEKEVDDIARIVSVGALKYSILKPQIGSDIFFDFETSISFDGDSGPYLQYSLVRAQSVLRKAEHVGLKPHVADRGGLDVTLLERSLVKFPEIVLFATTSLEPHHLVSYLTQIAGEFNQFYAQGPIVSEQNQNAAFQLGLVQAFVQVMERGLSLLGMRAPVKM